MKTDIELAFDIISGKRSRLDELWSYANGPQPLVYSNERLREAFDDSEAHFEINWCAVIVDATLDRIQLVGFDTPEDAVDARMKELFRKLHLDIEANQAHYSALSTQEAYVIVWKQADGEIEAYYNDPRMCCVVYDALRPKVKKFAAKQFVRDDGEEITLYYPDRIEHWFSAKKEPSKADAFVLENVEPNPFGAIPVFELTSPGEFVKVTAIQDQINKLNADMMVAAEFGAYAQRYVISQADPGALKNGGNVIWWIPSGDNQGQNSEVGQFESASLKNYLDAMDQLANSMAVISRTPKHYLLSLGSNISGEAVMAMEAPLVKKVKSRQREFAAQWQEVAAFMLKLDGQTVEPSEITVLWDRPESIQPYTEAQARQLAVNTGIPLITALRREGWSEVEIESMMKDMEEERAKKENLGSVLLQTLRARQEQANAAPSGDGGRGAGDVSDERLAMAGAVGG